MLDIASSLAPHGIARDGRREAVRPNASDRAGTPHRGPLLHVRKRGAFSGASERLQKPRPVHPVGGDQEEPMPSTVFASLMRTLGTLAAFVSLATVLNGASFARTKPATANGVACSRADTVRCKRLWLLDAKRVNPPDRVRPMAGLACDHRDGRHPMCREVVVIRGGRR